MADHIDYGSMDFDEPEPIRSFEANKSMIEWFLTHSRKIDTRVRFHLTSKSDGELQRFNRSGTGITPTKKIFANPCNHFVSCGSRKKVLP